MDELKAATTAALGGRPPSQQQAVVLSPPRPVAAVGVDHHRGGSGKAVAEAAPANTAESWSERLRFRPAFALTMDLPDWLRAFELDPDLAECENRPWANAKNRVRVGCVGSDFVFQKDPPVLFRFFWNNREKYLTGSCTFRENSEGPPKGAHGASVCMVFDEILAYPVWRQGYTAYTVNLSIKLKRMVPLGSTQRFFARISRIENRKLHLDGEVTNGDKSIVYATGSGIWVQSEKISSIDIRSVL